MVWKKLCDKPDTCLLSQTKLETMSAAVGDSVSSVDKRLKALEEMVLGGEDDENGEWLSIETLLDLVIVLYDECCNSTLRKEKNVAGFIERGEFHGF